MVGGTWEEFLLTTWLTGIKYPVKITLPDTKTVILLILVIKIKKSFLRILNLWSEREAKFFDIVEFDDHA